MVSEIPACANARDKTRHRTCRPRRLPADLSSSPAGSKKQSIRTQRSTTSFYHFASEGMVIWSLASIPSNRSRKVGIILHFSTMSDTSITGPVQQHHNSTTIQHQLPHYISLSFIKAVVHYISMPITGASLCSSIDAISAVTGKTEDSREPLLNARSLTYI